MTIHTTDMLPFLQLIEKIKAKPVQQGGKKKKRNLKDERILDELKYILKSK